MDSCRFPLVVRQGVLGGVSRGDDKFWKLQVGCAEFSRIVSQRSLPKDSSFQISVERRSLCIQFFDNVESVVGSCCPHHGFFIVHSHAFKRRDVFPVGVCLFSDDLLKNRDRVTKFVGGVIRPRTGDVGLHSVIMVEVIQVSQSHLFVESSDFLLSSLAGHTALY